QRVRQKNILRQFQRKIIEDINDKGTFLEDKTEENKEIQREFDEQNSVDFYKELENYQSKDKHNRSWGFIFRSYYWKKITANENLTNEIKKRLKKDILKYSVEHLAPQTSRKGENRLETIINSLGNITLLRKTDNSTLSNKD
ncbi:6961_t:CDS:1, partial [Racocetra persica]